jgi:hypothetical protein
VATKTKAKVIAKAATLVKKVASKSVRAKAARKA